MGRAARVARTVSGLWFGFGGEPASAYPLRLRHPGRTSGLRYGFPSWGSAFAYTTDLRLPGPFVHNSFRTALRKAGYEEGRAVGQAGNNSELRRDRSTFSGAPEAGVGHGLLFGCPLISRPGSCRKVLPGGFLRRDFG